MVPMQLESEDIITFIKDEIKLKDIEITLGISGVWSASAIFLVRFFLY